MNVVSLFDTEIRTIGYTILLRILMFLCDKSINFRAHWNGAG